MVEAQQKEIDGLSAKILRVNEYIGELQAEQVMPGSTGDYLRSILSGN